MAIAFFLAAASTVAAGERIVMSTTFSPPMARGDGTGIAERLAAEAFRRIGRELEIVTVPTERSLMNANAGIDDGELVRVGGLEKLYPNLRMIPEPLFKMEFSAFVVDSGIGVAGGWEGLARHRVGIVRGWKIVEEKVSDHPAVARFNFPKEMFAALGSGAIDVAVIGRAVGVEQAKMAGIDAHAVEPPLHTTDGFMYINARHAPLVERLRDALVGMKKDGKYAAILKDFSGTYAPSPYSKSR